MKQIIASVFFNINRLRLEITFFN